MKSDQNPGATRFTAREWYAVAFGVFLGLALLKFGNPVILDDKIPSPSSWSHAWTDAWPPHWANRVLTPLALLGVGLAIAARPRWPASRWLGVLPALWFSWQLVSATHTVDARLTALTLCQFGGCAACYFLGALVLGRGRGLNFLMIGLLAGFTFCLVRAVEQRVFEFPRERQMLLEGERTGWTNFPPDLFLEMKAMGFILNTNGVDVVNPAIMAKYEKGRVHGTLVYPNALAGAVLLLLPAAMVLAVKGTRRFRRPTRVLAIGLTIFLGASGLVWSGSKSGWLIALALGVLAVWRARPPGRFKWVLVLVVVVGGLTFFGVRFQKYFAQGATSVGARFDYWRVAVRITGEHSLFGSGPGTFQRLYASLKAPDAEMARLTHNDYLEQFSDSGIIGGVSYLSWIGLLLWTAGRRSWKSPDRLELAVFLGLLGWFVQGTIEFSLYVPALAWTAFTLSGCLLARGSGALSNSITEARRCQSAD